MRKLRFGLAALVALAEAAVAVALVFSSNHDTNPWIIAPFAVTAGLSFDAAGLVALWRRPENATGFWLAATGYLWFVAALGESNQSWVWTVGFCIGNLGFVAFVALILAYPDGTLSRRDRWLVTIGGVTAIGGNTLAALIDETPNPTCSGCPPSAIAIADLPGLKSAVTLIGTVIVIAVLAAVVVTLVQRWRRASVVRRRLLRPVFATCGVSIGLLLLSLLVDRIDSTAYSVLWVVFLLSFTAVPLAFLAGVLRSRLERASVARLLLSLDEGIPLRNTLAQALHDPSLEVAYWIESSRRWVDSAGRGVADPVRHGRRSVTTVERHGERIAALIHDHRSTTSPTWSTRSPPQRRSRCRPNVCRQSYATSTSSWRPSSTRLRACSSTLRWTVAFSTRTSRW